MHSGATSGTRCRTRVRWAARCTWAVQRATTPIAVAWVQPATGTRALVATGHRLRARHRPLRRDGQRRNGRLGQRRELRQQNRNKKHGGGKQRRKRKQLGTAKQPGPAARPSAQRLPQQQQWRSENESLACVHSKLESRRRQTAVDAPSSSGRRLMLGVVANRPRTEPPRRWTLTARWSPLWYRPTRRLGCGDRARAPFGTTSQKQRGRPSKPAQSRVATLPLRRRQRGRGHR